MHQFEDRCHNSRHYDANIVSKTVYHGSNVLFSWCFIKPCCHRSAKFGTPIDEETLRLKRCVKFGLLPEPKKAEEKKKPVGKKGKKGNQKGGDKKQNKKKGGKQTDEAVSGEQSINDQSIMSSIESSLISGWCSICAEFRTMHCCILQV